MPANRRTLPITPLHALDYEAASKTCNALARQARETADELEALLSRFQDSGAFGEIRRYAVTHRTQLPDVSPREAAQALRQYAGILALIAGKLNRPSASLVAIES